MAKKEGDKAESREDQTDTSKSAKRIAGMFLFFEPAIEITRRFVGWYINNRQQAAIRDSEKRVERGQWG